MDYSLQNLNKVAKLKNLTLDNFVEKLNMIGLEVDEVSYEKLSTNLFLENIRIFLKIPANREDLLNEKFFLNEISTIFLFEIYELWKQVKLNYFSVLKEHSLQYKAYSTISISSELKCLVSYVIEIKNPIIKKSPLWIINKLSNFGLKSENNFIDSLNLVFNEWGQNINILENSDTNLGEFKIEYLTQSESYIDSNNNRIHLFPGTIVLKNKINNKILTVLGIVNSTFSQTNLIKKDDSYFLEATFYDIHTNSLNLNTLNSKISLKYLRRACFENLKFSFQRVLTLLELLTSCTIIPTIYSTINEKVGLEEPKILCLKKRNIIHFLNICSADPVIFEKAGLKLVCETSKEYYFRIPSYRHDLEREIDIIEEYSRFIGYKNFPENIPQKTVTYTKNLFRQKYFIKNFFLNYGFNEIITNPIADFENRENSSILISNPLNNELSTLRRSLIPKLLNIFENNSRSAYIRNNFFEIGRCFKLVKNKIVEQDKLSGIFQLSNNKLNKKNSQDWFISKGFIENFLANFGYLNLEIKKVKKEISYFHPTKSILFFEGDRVLGVFGELNPILVKEKYSHVRGTIYLFELNINHLNQWRLNSVVKNFNEYSKYPLIIKDLSLIISKEVDFNFLKSFIMSQSIYLKKVSFFDIYFDENILETVNIGVRLEFQSKTETLTNESIENEIEKLRIVIGNNFGIKTRI